MTCIRQRLIDGWDQENSIWGHEKHILTDITSQFPKVRLVRVPPRGLHQYHDTNLEQHPDVITAVIKDRSTYVYQRQTVNWLKVSTGA